MLAATLLCPQCHGVYSPGDPIWSCPSCGSMLEIQTDLADRSAELKAALVEANRDAAPGLWRYSPAIPVDAGRAVSMGEGNTPIVHLESLGQKIGLPHLYAKLECLSPTGSFKDRGTTVLVSKARELGVSHLVEDSSGNAGASIAAYCARAGIQASIYVPASAPVAKKAQIGVYGARVVAVEGARDDVTTAALEGCQQEGGYYGSHNWNPWFLEGTKTFAYEVASHFHFDPPEHLVMPVGNGSLLLGSWKGFQELRTLGLMERVPRLHVAQSTRCMPIVDAFWRGLEETRAIPISPTVAGGISIGRPSRGGPILRAMRDSGGSGVAVDDEDILAYQRMLASLEGIFCEPTSATAFAVLRKLLMVGALQPEERVLVAVTGIGLKDVGVLTEASL